MLKGELWTLRSSSIFENFKEFLDNKKITGKIDAIYFSLHGAMGTTKENDWFLLEETRKIVDEYQ